MREFERRETGLLTATDELRQLIIDNPGLPLLVFAGQDCNNGDYGYMSCGNVSASLGEFLDCLQEVNEEYCYTDRDEFEEALADLLDPSDFCCNEEFEKFIKARLAEYEPYWKRCIILYVNN